jgi:N-acetylglucosamine kinase-like BadF-type ATPase
MKNILLAIDIGGSKTRIQLLDTDGNILSETCGVGVASAMEDTAPLPLLDELLSKIPDKNQIVAAAINLGGKNTEQVKSTVISHFPNIPIRIFRESEGTAAYALGDEYDAPIILMAGTGAIAVGKACGRFVTTGGWGINIGDEGSGYDIGLNAIRMTLQALDGTEPLPPLAQYISGCDTALIATDDPAMYRDNRDKVRENFYPLDRQHIASFTKIVADFAERGDTLALKIFEQAGESLAALVSKTLKKLDNAKPSVVVTGGLVHTKKFWSPSFEKHLSGMSIRYVTDGLLLGTRCIAKELYKTGDKIQ